VGARRANRDAWRPSGLARTTPRRGSRRPRADRSRRTPTRVRCESNGTGPHRRGFRRRGGGRVRRAVWPRHRRAQGVWPRRVDGPDTPPGASKSPPTPAHRPRPARAHSASTREGLPPARAAHRAGPGAAAEEKAPERKGPCRAAPRARRRRGARWAEAGRTQAPARRWSRAAHGPGRVWGGVAGACGVRDAALERGQRVGRRDVRPTLPGIGNTVR
jgi:hypothetical protein